MIGAHDHRKKALYLHSRPIARSARPHSRWPELSGRTSSGWSTLQDGEEAAPFLFQLPQLSAQVASDRQSIAWRARNGKL